MNPMDFFDPNYGSKKIRVPTGTVNNQLVSRDNESSDDDFDNHEPEETGLHYAREYQKKEFNMYASSSMKKAQTGALSGITDDFLENLDEATQEEVNELKTQAVAKVFREYNFSSIRTNSLPIDYYKMQILDTADSSSVVIIHGPTGCGKTTQVPQFFLDEHRQSNTYCNIVVTQPRRIAAISVAKRVCEERGWALGSICGYQVGLEKTVSNDTILTYMTTGVLLQKLAVKKSLREYTHIIIDEIHERTQEMDFLLVLIRRFLYTDLCNVKVVLMSATFDTKKFAHYFRTYSMGRELQAPTVMVRKPGNFNTFIYYLDQISNDKIEFDFDLPKFNFALFDDLVRLIAIFNETDTVDEQTKRKKIGNVLVFLPGIYEIEETYKKLVQQHNKWIILPLHSSITTAEQRKVFMSPPADFRKIILSTNIAESSLTVPDVEYVIDFCLTKNMTVDPLTQYQSLKMEWASHVNCEQRAGRVGRVRDGKVYRLVPTDFYEMKLKEDMRPEMLRAPLERVVLCAKILDFTEPPKAILALAIDPPMVEQIEATLLTLKEVGALLVTCRGTPMKIDGDLTFLGNVMSKLPLDVKCSKMICLGYMFGMLNDAIIMAAGCSLSNIFTSPFQEKMKSYKNRLKWADCSSSDLIAYLNLYWIFENHKRTGSFPNEKSEKLWCQQNYLSYRGLREWRILVQEITERLRLMGIAESTGPGAVNFGVMERPIVLKILICGAFYPNYFKSSSDCGQVEEREAIKTLNGLNPMQTVYYTGLDQRQPGPLYAKRIKDLFKPITDNIKIQFDASSKVYVSVIDTVSPRTINLYSRQFVTSMPGSILPDVYNAIKMRHIVPKHDIPVMSPEKSWSRAKQLNIAHYKDKEYKVRKANDENNILPGLKDVTICILVTATIDAGRFFAQRSDEFCEKNISLIDQTLNPVVQKFPSVKDPKLNTMYISKYSDDRFYRCKVIELYEDKTSGRMAYIQFCDYGNMESVRCTLLWELPEGPAKTLPPQAIECVLCGLKPSAAINPKGLWSEEANSAAKKFLMNEKFIAQIYSVVQGIMSVELFSSSRTESFNQWLIGKEYAQEAEESFFSKENHNKRLQAQTYDSVFEVVDVDELNLYDCTKTVDAPHERECTAVMTLKGPYSPLEMQVFPVCDSGQRVKIEGSSVNSVMLDSDPQDPHERLLVATTISQIPHTTDISLRHTTVMPNVHGLSTIMAVLFCPRTSSKPTADGSRYAAFLCGLGEYDESQKPLFPAHDMVMTLDTRIDREDIRDINEIRFWMNHSVKSMEDICSNVAPCVAIEVCQRELKDRIFKLIKKKRPSQERAYVRNANKWHKYEYNGTLLQPGDILMDKDVWPLHRTMELKADNEEYVKTCDNLNLMHEMSKRLKNFAKITCLLCSEELHNVEDLQIHLSRNPHMDLEKAFK